MYGCVPGFETHLSTGKNIGGVLGVAFGLAAFADGVSPQTSVLIGLCTFLLVVIGSTLPDIDHHASIPRRILGGVALLIGVFGLVLAAPVLPVQITDQIDAVTNSEVPEVDDEIAALAGLAVAVIIISRIDSLSSFVGNIFDSILTHRGFTHSSLFMVLAGAIVYFVSKPIMLDSMSMTPDNAKTYALAFGVVTALGIMHHLDDDGVL
jgi:hypothetical protein